MNLGRFRHIHAHCSIFRHNQTYPDIIMRHIQVYSEPCVTLALFGTPVYSESWHIQNQRHIQIPGISKNLAYSEPQTYLESQAIQNPGIFRTRGILRTLFNIYDGVLLGRANGYNYSCNISFSCPLVPKTKIIFLMQGQFFFHRSLINVEKVYGQGREARDREI